MVKAFADSNRPPDIGLISDWINVCIRHCDYMMAQTPEIRQQRAAQHAQRRAFYRELDNLNLVRAWFAAGVVRFLPRSEPRPSAAPIIISEVMGQTIWLLVTSQKFRDPSWQVALAVLASPRLARLISRIYNTYWGLKQDLPPALGEHYIDLLRKKLKQELYDPQYAEGMRNVLDDLRDTYHGGYALTSVFQRLHPDAPPRQRLLAVLESGASEGINSSMMSGRRAASALPDYAHQGDEPHIIAQREQGITGNEPAATGDGALRLHVYDPQSGQDINGAWVAFWGHNRRHNTTTDAAGMAYVPLSLEDSGQSRKVSVQAAGYSAFVEEVEVVPGKLLNVRLLRLA